MIIYKGGNMSKIIVKIKDNKYTEIEIDNMLNDYINMGENIFKRRIKVAYKLLKDFENKYDKDKSIIGKRRDLKQFLNSAKLMYELAEFYLCSNTYDKYIYILNKNHNGVKVHLYFGEKLGLIYNSLPTFLENWYIYKKIGKINFEK